MPTSKSHYGLVWRCIWVGMIKHNVAVMSGVSHEAEITEGGRRSARRIRVLIFCCYLYTCTFVHVYTCTLSWMRPHCVLLCLFSFLAVEPFNTQPQLYYIALSRSYKGSFSAWCPVRADMFLFKWSWQHALIPLHFLLPTWKHASVALRWLEVHSSLLSVETFPITLSSPGRKLLSSLVAKTEGCLVTK